MPTTLQFRRGTEAQNNSFTGSAGEITFDTTNKTLRAHDGSTAGGSTLATETYVDNAVGSLSADSISNGTSTLSVIASGGNIRANVGGSQIALVTSSGVDVTGSITTTSTLTVGTDLTVSGGDIILSGTGRIQGIDTVSSGTDAASKTYVDNAVAGIVDSAPAALDTLNELAAALGDDANFSTTVTNSIGTKLTKSGDTMSGDLNMGGNDITNAGTFNGTATAAQYADLAEKYSADAEYAPGTVLVVGGSAEVTACSKYADSSAAGVVSTAPAHLMNSGLDTQHTVDLALLGRVPCRVVGAISKGDLLTTSEIEGIATRLMPDSFVPGCVIGKALEDYSSEEVGVIEILVGKT